MDRKVIDAKSEESIKRTTDFPVKTETTAAFRWEHWLFRMKPESLVHNDTGMRVMRDEMMNFYLADGRGWVLKAVTFEKDG